MRSFLLVAAALLAFGATMTFETVGPGQWCLRTPLLLT